VEPEPREEKGLREAGRPNGWHQYSEYWYVTTHKTGVCHNLENEYTRDLEQTAILTTIPNPRRQQLYFFSMISKKQCKDKVVLALN
jgi:hypothetical protein